MNEPEAMITVQEAARRLNRSIEQVRRYLREGKLRGRRIGQQWFIDEASLRIPPLRYQAGPSREGQLREAAAVMEKGAMSKEEIEALFKRIDERREAIRRRLGGEIDVDIVEILRQERESH
ncbi:MAG TPA: helix-turn-helix domain-containing protein [Dehalococcoidia bacterium]|nr:helix-turn-helix domain-containing protein [Dehalococcoidia bacterium]